VTFGREFKPGWVKRKKENGLDKTIRMNDDRLVFARNPYGMGVPKKTVDRLAARQSLAYRLKKGWVVGPTTPY